MNESGLTQTGKFSAAELTAIQNYVNSQGGQYQSYWKNIGNSRWSYNGGTTTAAQALTDGPNRHQNMVNCVFVDGHAKAIQYKEAVGNLCHWVTSEYAGCTN